MKNNDELKAKRKKELLAKLEAKKKDLKKHFEETASKSIDASKGLLTIGASVFLIYTIFNRFLESKLKVTEPAKAKSSSNNLLYPIFSMLLQQGAGVLFDLGQKKLLDYLKNKRQLNERLSKDISTK